MYYDYGIISGREQPTNMMRNEYNGLHVPGNTFNGSGNFMFLRNHSERKRISEIDMMLAAANEEYIALSRSVITAGDAVKGYVQTRIDELQNRLTSLERERSRLLSAQA